MTIQNQRRTFLKHALACMAVQRSGKRPNVLFAIADDQSYPHTGVCGSGFVKTPAFDRVARQGVLFRNAFVSTPSCCPSRGSVLTGQDFYRLKEASMNHTVWPGGMAVYPDLLANAGYAVGCTGKGWGPGNWRVSGRRHSPCGPEFNRTTLSAPGRYIGNFDYAANLEAFLNEKRKGAPFCFWAGIVEPHREYEKGVGIRHGKRLEDVQVPSFLPDAAEVRSDLADYAFEIEWADRQLARMMQALEKRGELDNTIIVVTADNGMPFPRAKANLYDYGTRVPLAISWGARAKPGRVLEDFVSFTDFAPTFLEAAGLAVPREMTGRSLLPLLLSSRSGEIDPARDAAVSGIERHFPGSRPNGTGYPSRAIRTREYLYIRNYAPDRSPVGDRPGPVWPDDDPVGGFGDTDGGPSKTCLWENREKYPDLYRLAFEKRPSEELYLIPTDQCQLRSVAGDPKHATAKTRLSERLQKYLERTHDPRATGKGELLDAVTQKYPTLGSNR